MNKKLKPILIDDLISKFTDNFNIIIKFNLVFPINKETLIKIIKNFLLNIEVTIETNKNENLKNYLLRFEFILYLLIFEPAEIICNYLICGKIGGLINKNNLFKIFYDIYVKINEKIYHKDNKNEFKKEYEFKYEEIQFLIENLLKKENVEDSFQDINRNNKNKIFEEKIKINDNRRESLNTLISETTHVNSNFIYYQDKSNLDLNDDIDITESETESELNKDFFFRKKNEDLKETSNNFDKKINNKNSNDSSQNNFLKEAENKEFLKNDKKNISSMFYNKNDSLMNTIKNKTYNDNSCLETNTVFQLNCNDLITKPLDLNFFTNRLNQEIYCESFQNYKKENDNIYDLFAQASEIPSFDMIKNLSFEEDFKFFQSTEKIFYNLD